MSNYPHLPPGDLPQEPPSLLQDSSRAHLTPKKRSAQYLPRSDDAGTPRSAVAKPSPSRRDAAAAIIRHIRKHDQAPTHFTDADFMAPLTSPTLWLELCGNLSKNKSVKTKFRRILKDGDLESHGLGVYYLGLNAKGLDHYYLDFCEPTERKSKRKRRSTTVGRASEGTGTRKEIPDSEVDDFGDRFGSDGLLMSPDGGRPSRKHSVAAVIHGMVRQNGGTMTTFSLEHFLREFDNQWKRLCWPLKRHELWRRNLTYMLKKWNRTDLIDFKKGPGDSFALAGYETKRGEAEVAPRAREEVEMEPKMQSDLHDNKASAGSDSDCSHGENYGNTENTTSQKTRGTVLVSKESSPESPKVSKVLISSPTFPCDKTAGGKLNEGSQGADISNSPMHAGNADLSIAHFDLAHLEEASNDVDGVARMKAKDLSKLIAAVMLNFDEDSLARVSELTHCLRIALKNTGVGGDMIATFIRVDDLVKTIVDDLKQNERYEAFGKNLTATFQWRLTEFLIRLRSSK